MKAMETWLMKYAERKQNMIIVIPSTPSQYFHVLRRQIHRSYAKPLIVMSAKWLLHHKLCLSELKDFYEGTYFQRIIVEGSIGDNMKRRKASLSSSSSSSSSSSLESLVEEKDMKRIIFCCGKIFYHLYHERELLKIKNIIIIRIEQLSPFPYDLIIPILQQYKYADIIWCQEEPKNMGAYSYIKPRLETAMRDVIDKENLNNNNNNEVEKFQRKVIQNIGRSSLAESASGGMKEHIDDQKNIIMNALRIL